MQNSQDARKSKLYGKIGKLIVQAVKAGGTDKIGNARLHDVLKQAQQASIPKDIIDRNISRAADKSQADFQEVLSTSPFHCCGACITIRVQTTSALYKSCCEQYKTV